jgi:uncharacterized cofD-like protein
MKLVAIGGGHGTAVTLRAMRVLTSDVVGIVSVADDGGSTGRLREMLDVAAVGDLRKCLRRPGSSNEPIGALPRAPLRCGRPRGPRTGQLLAGFLDATGDLERSVDRFAELLEVSGTVLPASRRGVTLVARTEEGRVEGQTTVAASPSIRTVAVEPFSATAPDRALEAIAEADFIVIGPGSLYTSVLAALVVPGYDVGPSFFGGPQGLRGQPLRTVA